jgi:hypothetical protein
LARARALTPASARLRSLRTETSGGKPKAAAAPASAQPSEPKAVWPEEALAWPARPRHLMGVRCCTLANHAIETIQANRVKQAPSQGRKTPLGAGRRGIGGWQAECWAMVLVSLPSLFCLASLDGKSQQQLPCGASRTHRDAAQRNPGATVPHSATGFRGGCGTPDPLAPSHYPSWGSLHVCRPSNHCDPKAF